MFRRTLITTLALAAMTPLAQAWTLAPESSTINFVSVKKGSVGEVHNFSGLTGTLDDSGQATLTIELGSVETGIAIRNERMQSMLFETSLFPEATVTATIDPSVIGGLVQGDVVSLTLPLTVALHGVSQTLEADLNLVRLGDDSVLVYSASPLILKADDFGLGAGIDKLREIAGLPSIATAVPVTVSLVFNN